MKKSSVKAKRLHHRPKAVALAVGASAPVPAVAKGNEVYKVRDYGKGGNLPHDIMRVFMASPTARRCIKKLKKFIAADGFANRTAAAHIINPQQRADDILPLLGWDLAVLEGFAVRVYDNRGGEAVRAEHVPFQTVRKLEDGRFLVNPTLGSSNYNKTKDEVLDAYDPNTLPTFKRVGEEGELQQDGRILYVFEENSAQPHYPEPDAWAAKEDIESDPEIQRADLNSIRNRVKPSTGVYVPGAIDEKTEDDDGKTEMDYVEDSVLALTDPDGKGDPAIFWGATKDDIPQIIEMPGMKNTLAMDQKSDTIRRRICMAFGVHPVLIGMETAGKLGNSQELVNIIQLTQQEVLDKQNMISRAFTMLFPDFDWVLSSLSLIKALPEQVWATMDENEQRNFIGLQEVDTNSELDKFKRLPDALKNKLLEVMTPEQLLKLGGFETENNPQPKAAANKPKPQNHGAIEREFLKLRAFLQKHIRD